MQKSARSRWLSTSGATRFGFILAISMWPVVLVLRQMYPLGMKWINDGSVAGANYAFALSALALVFVLLGSVGWRAKAINAGFVFINFLLLLQVLFGM